MAYREVTYFVEFDTPADGPDTLIKVTAPTHEDLIGGLGAVIQYERERGEVVTWPDNDHVLAIKDAKEAPCVFDGAYHVATLCLRFT